MDRALGFASSLGLLQGRWSGCSITATIHRFAGRGALRWLGGSQSAQYSDQDEPQHGGVTNWNTNSEYSFELVVDGKNATVHIEDHEVPVPTQGVKGTLSVTRDGATRRPTSCLRAKTA